MTARGPISINVRPERTTWPDDPGQRFEEIVVQTMTRLLELDAIARCALREEASAAIALIGEPLDDIRGVCADAMGQINAACRRREAWIDRQLEVDARCPA